MFWPCLAFPQQRKVGGERYFYNSTKLKNDENLSVISYLTS